MIVTKTCRYCKHYGIVFKKNGGIKFIGCRATNHPLRPDEATDDSICGTFKEGLEYTQKRQVAEFVCDSKCSGCEYAAYDLDGNAYPSDECCGCAEELNGFWDDYDKLTLQELIDKYTYGNDRVLALYMCGNFWDYFRGYKLVKKGDVRSFIKE